MKRMLLVCSLAIVFILLLSACAAYEASPVFDMAEAPAEMEVTPDVDDGVLYSFDIAREVAEPEAPTSADMEESWDVADDDWDFVEDAIEETIRIEVPAQNATPEPAPDAVDSDATVQQDYVMRDAAPVPILTPDNEMGLRLIYDVRMELQSTDFINGTSLLTTMIGEMGGFVLNYSMHGSDILSPERGRLAIYDFRLPTEHVSEFVVFVQENFNPKLIEQASEDITIVYEWDTWELEDLTELEEVLEGLLEDDDLETDERRDIEAYLAGVRSNIRNVEQRRSAMDYNILFSVINIRLEEVLPPVVEPEEEPEEEVIVTFGDRFGDAAASSFGGFVGFGQGLLIVIVTILPTLIVLGVITFAIIFSVRKYKKWRAANPKTEEPPPAPTIPPNNQPNYQNTNNNTYWNYNDPNNPNNAYSNQNAPTAAPQANVTENPHNTKQ